MQEDRFMKIAIAGTGYVGLSNGILLAQHNEVVALDIIPEKIEMLNKKILPIEDAELKEYLTTKPLNFTATLNKNEAFENADFVVGSRYLGSYYLITGYTDCPGVMVRTSGNDIARAGGEGNIISTDPYHDPRAVCLS